MTDAAHTPSSNPPLKRRHTITPVRVKVRKTFEFSVRSIEHQRIILEALQVQLATEKLRRKRARLTWMIRRLNETLQVAQRIAHAR